MAYRKIHDQFWTDPDIEELTPEQKYFYLYLLTNPGVNQIGLYELSVKRACYETGYNTDTVLKLLAYFESKGKIKQSKITHEILIVKFYHHNYSRSPKVEEHVNKLLKEVKDTSLIQYIYSMHTQTQEEEEEEEYKEEKKVQDKKTPTRAIPTLDDCISFSIQNGGTEQMATKFFHHYNEQGWLKPNGLPITVWESAAIKWINTELHDPTKHNKPKPASERFKGGLTVHPD